MDRFTISREIERHAFWRTIRHLVRRHAMIFLDYPVHPVPRYGHGNPPHPELHSLLERGRDDYRGFLQRCLELAESLVSIPVRGDARSQEPAWINGFLPGLDSAALYAFLTHGNPERYVEIGSGNSTKFARRAIRDHGLRTRITSIDPEPRADIDALSDDVVRFPLEAVDLGIITSLRAGDVLFLDGSHRCFTNSDVTVAFLEILPRLAPGVRVQIHDICLPYDYPPTYGDRFYSEQYVLAAYLLGGGNGARVLLPNAFVSQDPELDSILDPIWSRPGFGDVERHGSSFWLEIAGTGPTL